ncbi:MAG: glycosyltransferase family 4 protein [Acidimicrobiia bacterium]|nr:glycosyltransferase family 4 protein [Acidimicrobiia bacterium]
MRLLLITNDYLPKAGGIQQYLGNLVERYDGPVQVIAPKDTAAERDAQVVRSKRKFMWPTRGTRRWIEEHADRFNPDVILFGAPYPLPTMGPALRASLGVPYGVIAHGAEVTVPAAFPGTRQLLAGPVKQADVVFANSRWTAGKVERITKRSVTHLGIGVDLESFHPSDAGSSDELVVGCVSRFIPRKGHAEVLHAAAGLRSRGYRVRASIVGRGRLEKRLRQVAESLEVPTDFHVDIPWAELPGRYREMDVFAMPCRNRWLGLEQEGLGIVFLEAAASGLPVVAGASGGAPETVLPGRSGFVVHDRDGLVEALEILVSDRARMSAMGTAGRAYMEDEFTWDQVMERLRSGLEQAVKNAS